MGRVKSHPLQSESWVIGTSSVQTVPALKELLGQLKGVSMSLCSNVLHGLIAAGLTSTLGCLVVAGPALLY